MDNIKVVMFDLGNVIICFDHMIAVKEISKYCGYNPEEIYNLFFSSDLVEEFDKGGVSEEEFFKQIRKILNLNGLNKERFYNIWNDIFWENPGVSDLIEEIKKKYEKFFIISNVNRSHFEYIYKNFPIVRKADEIILSYKVGVLKPDSKIYQIAIEKAGCSASNIFYTDDREELIEAAKNIGFNAVKFEDKNQIEKFLF
jgi:putative hydrolase of the HAD superfamily